MDAATRRAALAVGAVTGIYGIPFGAAAVAAGLSATQARGLSLTMYTGASQFAFVGVLGTGGSLLAAALTAVLLGARNAFYGLHLAGLLGAAGPRRWLAAHLTIDESAAMALAREDDPSASRAAFWATGVAVLVLWNVGTLVGALEASSLGDPAALGLDAAAPAAFLALAASRLRDRPTAALALAGAGVAVLATPATAAGVPILLAAALAVVLASRTRRGRRP